MKIKEFRYGPVRRTDPSYYPDQCELFIRVEIDGRTLRYRKVFHADVPVDYMKKLAFSELGKKLAAELEALV